MTVTATYRLMELSLPTSALTHHISPPAYCPLLLL